MSKTGCQMVIDHAGGLGKGIHDHRPAEIEAALLEVLRQRLAHHCLGRYLVAALEMIDLRLAAHMFPDQVAKAAGFFFLDLKPQPRALDSGLDLGAAAEDAFV